MRTNQLFVLLAMGISLTFVSVFSVIGFPRASGNWNFSLENWLSSDVGVGIILYFCYFLLALMHDSSKNKYSALYKM
ncbi:hypothetical protein [Nitrosomonas communis]|uniref:Uncharacterized protein n=1 Tax=Nitrosomonas communis TaxID=44574 RepID=A0A1I4NK09_9PROT|nr:hypothetical protein [Nitrosomonas communis]SFM15647.1 hypothetical protein SAMN05421863_101530 [Nitrosomonas communis]